MTEFKFTSEDDNRNEVSIDLEKFMEMQNTISEQRDLIREYERVKNPWMNWVHFAQALDAFRPFPRIFMGAYIIMLFSTMDWAMSLDDITTQQAAFVSAIVGLATGVFGFYVNSGKKE